MIRRETPHPVFSYLIYLGCLISLCTVSFNWGSGRNVFFVASYVAFLALAFNFKYYVRQKNLLWAPILFVTFGLGNILWVEAYKTPGEYINLYRAVAVTGKMLIATGFVLLIALNERIEFKKLITPILIILGVAMNSYGIYQSIGAKVLRSSLNYDLPTIAAYIITAIDILMLYSLLQLKNKYKTILFAFAFLLSFVAIIHTETRAAILVFPIASIVMFSISKNVNLKQKYTCYVSVFALIIISTFFMKNIIEKRVDAFRADMNAHAALQGQNSIGSRISMIQVGLMVGNQHIFGQSAEQRGNEMAELAKEYPALAGALPYAGVHLHNEIIDNYSLRGIWGVILLISLHISLLIVALRSQRNAALLALILSMILYGFSDVLFFSSEATAIFGLAVIFSVLIGNTSARMRLQNSDNEKNADK